MGQALSSCVPCLFGSTPGYGLKFHARNRSDLDSGFREAEMDDGYLQLRENERQFVEIQKLEGIKELKKNQIQLERIMDRWDRK